VSRIDRYLTREIAAPFVVGLGLFGVVVTFGELLKISDAVTGVGIGAGDFASALLYSLPPLFGLLLPVSGLFATLLAVGRLASDRELVALTAAGVSPYRLLWVPAATGLVLGGVSAVALLWGEPWGLQGLQRIMARGAQRAIAEGVRVGQFNEWVEGVTFFARGRDGDALTEVMLADRRDRERPVVVSARRGQVHAGAEARDLVFDLEDGAILLYESARPRRRLVRFERSRYRVDVGELVDDKLINVTRAQALYPGQLVTAIASETRSRRKALYTVTLHRKVALPLATLIFTLLAVPLAARAGGGARARGFLFSAAIVAGYYYVGRATELWARSGGLPAPLAAWVPNLIGLGLLAFLLWRLPRRFV
jgi:lipopolysaccharide export system permease protein